MMTFQEETALVRGRAVRESIGTITTIGEGRQNFQRGGVSILPGGGDGGDVRNAPNELGAFTGYWCPDADAVSSKPVATHFKRMAKTKRLVFTAADPNQTFALVHRFDTLLRTAEFALANFADIAALEVGLGTLVNDAFAGFLSPAPTTPGEVEAIGAVVVDASSLVLGPVISGPITLTWSKPIHLPLAYLALDGTVALQVWE